MEKKEKENLKNLIINLTEEFWSMDCLIRMIKEILTNDNWETREEDVYTICNLLIKESKSLSEEILLLRKALKS